MTAALAEQQLTSDVTVRPLTRGDAPAMHVLLVASRAHLDRWLRWSSSLGTLDHVATFIAGFEARLAANDGFHRGVWTDGAVTERLGFHAEGVRRESHWITDRFVDHVVYGMLDREWEAHSDG